MGFGGLVKAATSSAGLGASFAGGGLTGLSTSLGMGAINPIMGAIGGIGQFGYNLATGGAQESLQAQREANATNVMLARENTAFQERMSNTSYQRGMLDMKAAGLNPMLAYMKGGASTPSGQVGHVEPVDKGKLYQGFMNQVEKAVNLRNLSSSTEVNKTQASANEQSVENKKVEKDNTLADTELKNKQTETALHTAKKAKNEAKVSENERRVSDAAVDTEISLAKAKTWVNFIKEIFTGSAAAVGTVYGGKKIMLPERVSERINPRTGEIISTTKRR